MVAPRVERQRTLPRRSHALRSSTMSETHDTRPAPAEIPQVAINPLVLHRSRLPFTISLASFVALLLLIFTPTLIQPGHRTSRPIPFRFRARARPRSSCCWRCICRTLLLFVTTIVSGYVGYKLVVAVGREPGKSDPAEQLRAAGAADPGGQGGVDRPIRAPVQPERLHRNLHQARADRPAADDGRAHADLRGARLAAARHRRARRASST